jgi:hypothetical protein
MKWYDFLDRCDFELILLNSFHVWLEYADYYKRSKWGGFIAESIKEYRHQWE